MLIGVTGLIGAGKSTAAAILATFGAVVVDADKIGKSVVDNSPQLLSKLKRQFGDGIVDHKGKLIRQKLARLAFRDDISRDRLNSMVHPYLLRELREQVKSLLKAKKIVVIDAALLLDWNLDRKTDFVIVVHAGLKIRIRRLARRGLSASEVRARTTRQLPYAEYRRRADYFILNNQSPTYLKRRLEIIYTTLSTR